MNESSDDIQNFLFRKKIKKAGDWLFNPIGLFGLLFTVASGALANFLNPLWFAEFSLVFTGISIVFCAISIVGLVLQAVFLGLVLRDNPKSFSFANVRRSLSLDYLVVNALGSIVFLAILVALDWCGVLTPFINAVKSALVPVFNQLITIQTAKILTAILFAITPTALASGIWRIATTLFLVDKSVRHPLDPTSSNEQEESSGDHLITLRSSSASGNDECSHKNLDEEHVYTPEQKEYVRNHPARYLVRALCHFVPEKSDQLALNKGDLIWVVDAHPEEEWWKGEMAETGEQGFFNTQNIQVLRRKMPEVKAVGESVDGNVSFVKYSA